MTTKPKDYINVTYDNGHPAKIFNIFFGDVLLETPDGKRFWIHESRLDNDWRNGGGTTSELCPICDKPLYESGKTLTSREDEKVVHLGCYTSHPCDCPNEDDGCHFSEYCEHHKAPNKELNGTWLPTCGVKFPDRSD